MDVIADAYDRLPTKWPGMEHGHPYRVIARHPLPANPLALDVTEPQPIDAVEFTWERGELDSGLPGWRIVARYQGEERTMTCGVYKQSPLLTPQPSS